MAPAMLFTWVGNGFRPIRRFEAAAEREFETGQVYRLGKVEERSDASHGHYFATLHEGWLNLPEDQAERFPSPEHLRKWCLIRAGFSDSQTLVASSKAEALRLAAFIGPIDEFSVVTVKETTVTRWTAQSQSKRAMGAKAFQASKTAVLEIIAGMVDVPVAELEQSRAA